MKQPGPVQEPELVTTPGQWRHAADRLMRWWLWLLAAWISCLLLFALWPALVGLLRVLVGIYLGVMTAALFVGVGVVTGWLALEALARLGTRRR